MKNAWLVRPFPNEIKRLKEFKQNNLIAIGWHGLGDLTGKSREEIKTILTKEPYLLDGMKLGSAYATIDIFVNRMACGDLVLVPDGEDIYFATITSDYRLEKTLDNKENGYPHQRSVKWLGDVSRKDLSMPLRSSLKVHRTTADLTKHFAEIDSLSRGETFSQKVVDCPTIAVAYPLRKDFMVEFQIPADITKNEAKRLSAYLESLYFTE